MAFADLRAFIAHLEERGRLHRIREPVSRVLELTEIQRRVLLRGGPALLFEQVEGSRMPVLVNLFGTVERVAWGMGREPGELRALGELLAFLRQPRPPESFRELRDLAPALRAALTMRPKRIARPPCQEIVWRGEEVDLSRLPIPTCWPGEPAPLLTWPLVVTRGPGDGRDDDVNLGIYRMQVLGRDRAIMRWLRHRGGAQQFRRWKRARPGEPFPAAAVIGADPGVILAAVTPLPDDFSEYRFAGLLRGERVELAPALTVPLEVPARAEIVLEGHVDPEEEAEEGPYGDHTGYYNVVERFPVFRITAITMRRDPIFLSTYTGRPPDEPSVLGEALNEIFIPLIRQQFPEVVDFWLPPEGCSYRVAVVSIRKAYPGHARRIMMGVWSYLRQFTYTKFVIVVDDDIDCRDWKDVVWAIATRVDPARDLLVIDRTPIDYLDFASPEPGLGGKLGIDATNKWPPETKRQWGRPIVLDPEIVRRVDEKWARLGLEALLADTSGRG